MRALLAVVGCLCLLSMPALAAKPGAKSGKAKAAKASKSQAAAEPLAAKAGKAGKTTLEDLDGLEVPPEARRRVAFVEGNPPSGVTKKVLQSATNAAQAQLKGQGVEVLGTAQVAAAVKKLKLKAPACAGEVRCLTRLAKAAGCGVAASVVVTKAGKQYMIDLTLYDAQSGALVANEANVAASAGGPALAEALKRMGPLVVASLDKHLQAGQGEPPAALVVAPLEPAAKPAVEPLPSLVSGPEARPAAQPLPFVEPRPVAAPDVKVALASGEDTEPKAPVAAAATSPAPSADLALQAAPSGSPWGRRILPMTLMGLGAGGIGVGVGLFGTQARSAAADFQNGKNPVAARDQAKQAALLSDISTGAGAALLVTGAALMLFTGGSSGSEAGPSAPAPDPTFAIGPSGTGVAMAGTF